MTLMIGEDAWCERFMTELRRLDPDHPHDDCEQCARDVCDHAYGADTPEEAAAAYVEQTLLLSGRIRS